MQPRNEVVTNHAVCPVQPNLSRLEAMLMENDQSLKSMVVALNKLAVEHESRLRDRDESLREMIHAFTVKENAPTKFYFMLTVALIGLLYAALFGLAGVEELKSVKAEVSKAVVGAQ